MPLPTSTVWDLVDFNPANMSTLLAHPDVTALPAGAPPYFEYESTPPRVDMGSNNGTESSLSFDTPVPGNFTVEVGLRFLNTPQTFGDIEGLRIGFTVADDASRGFSMYFSTAGVAFSRVDDFGVVTPLPATSVITAELSAEIRVIRVAVDGVLGRAYVAFGTEDNIGNIEYIVPIEGTPDFAADKLRVFAKGTAGAPASAELRYVRLASSLVIPDFPPLAVAGPDQVTPVGQAIRLDGRGSYDSEGLDLSYLWRAVDAPFGSVYAAEGAGGFTIDDGDADGLTDRLAYPVGTLPAWVASGDVLQVLGERHVISVHDTGLGLIILAGDILPDNLTAAAFRIVDQSVISDVTGDTPYVLPDVQGLFRFELIVNDGQNASEASEVLVNTTGSRLPYGVEPDMSFLWKALGNEWEFLESKSVFEEAWVGAAQLLGAKMLELWQYHYNYSIKDAQGILTRRWLAYRTLTADEAPEEASFALRKGVLVASHDFALSAPLTPGTSLVVQAYAAGDLGVAIESTIALTVDTIDGLLTEINTGLPPGVEAYAFPSRGTLSAVNYWSGQYASTPVGPNTDIFNTVSMPAWVGPGDVVHLNGRRYSVASVAGPSVTVDVTGLPTTEWIVGGLSLADVIVYRRNSIGLRSNSTYFSVSGDSAPALGLAVDTLSSLSGVGGSIITDSTYYVGEGVDLGYHGIGSGDFLSINNGQVLEVLDILSGADPMENQRLLTRDELPVDASKEWTLPGQVVSAATDYSSEGVYPGDLIKVEIYDSSDGTEHSPQILVVGVSYRTLVADLSQLYWALASPERYEVRFVGVKRRKAIPLDEDIVGIPALQDRIAVAAEPEAWKENIDYIIEPFYRASDGSKLSMLQFRDATFLDPNIEPPDIFWAEYTNFTNDPQIESLFGRLAGFLRDDASELGTDFDYLSGVSGLLFARQQGPTLHAMRVGAQILLGQPFSEVNGYVLEVQTDYSALRGRIIIQDDNGNVPTTSEVIRTYIYLKDPGDLSITSGLDDSPETELPWAVGDFIEQFSPIGAGVTVVDYVKDPQWLAGLIGGASLTEVQKFHTYALQANSDLAKFDALEILLNFVQKAKQHYVDTHFVVVRSVSDDIDITETVTFSLQPRFVDHMSIGNENIYDAKNGDGDSYGVYGDGQTYDERLLAPDEVISVLVTVVWGGGTAPSVPNTFPQSHDIVDVDGNIGAPGSTFQPAAPDVIPAGNYEYTIVLKQAGVLDGSDALTWY